MKGGHTVWVIIIIKIVNNAYMQEDKAHLIKITS